MEISKVYGGEKSLLGATMIHYLNMNQEHIMKIQFSDGSNSEDILSLRETTEGLRLDYDNSHGEYYLLLENGDLGLYDEEGKFDEAKSIK